MFDGAADHHHQFHHQLVAPPTPTPRTTLPLHLSFPSSTSPTPNHSFLPNFDPYNPTPPNFPLQTNILLPHKHQHQPKQPNTTLDIETDQRQLPPKLLDSWTNDEVLALLRIRSTMDNWKLAELGFKKSAEKCKERFEDETGYFNNLGKTSYRFVSELEELYHQQNPHHDQVVTEKTMEGEGGDSMGHTLEENSTDINKMVVEKSRKRKRRDKFEMLKGFCESIVNKMMAQQEEIHNKLLHEMLKRDEEKLAREEAWKKQEMDKFNKELEIMAQEQAIVSDRHATIIQFLNKYLSSSTSTTTSSPPKCKTKGNSSPILTHSQNPNPCNLVKLGGENPRSSETTILLQQVVVPSNSSNSISTMQKNSCYEKEDVGRRWPRDEVLALIKLRCSVMNSNEEEKEGNNNKGPLWERISQGMSELGYKRSAKRCKEKWENINKYFRKTKDNKKRSLDSRTCPYFHQLTSLYSHEKLSHSDHHHHLNPTVNSGEVPPDSDHQAQLPAES
ncbi:Myb-like domain [Sesbania bispinosa]|nr:Myb-like domain [Sesbania bispinosa]